MKLDEFLSKLNLALNSKTTYKTGGWGSHNEDTWYFDCVCMIKGILWGWNADFTKKRGGAVYASNGVPDIGTEQIINKCKNVSTDFNNIQPGELLWMQGHVGIYVGNREVIECTAAWESKVLKSQVATDGTRSRNGKKCLKWQKHGFLPYVDYSNAVVETTPEPSKEPEVVGSFKVGDLVVPTRLVNYKGTKLKQYDDYYTITEINGDRAVLSANRNGKLVVWAAMNTKDIKLK